MKMNDIQVGQEYTISSGVLQDALYFAHYSKLKGDYFTITAEVIETGVEREFSQRNDGVRIKLTGAAYDELKDHYFDRTTRENDFVISNRQVLESTAAIEAERQRKAEEAAQREAKYAEEQRQRGAELDLEVLARMETRVHEEARYELNTVRQALEGAIKQAQDLLAYVENVETPSYSEIPTWTGELPNISNWFMGSIQEVPVAVAKYNLKAESHNWFVAARLAGQENN